jgi:hypothetical protein
MFASFSEATLYLQKNLNILDPNNPFDEEETREMLFDAVFSQIDDETLEKSLTDSDRMLLQDENIEEEVVISILSNRIPKFYTMLTEMVAEILSEYMTEDGDEMPEEEDKIPSAV